MVDETKKPRNVHECMTKLAYNERFDAFFCPTCDEWISAACGATDHSQCGYECWKRPSKPSEDIDSC